MEKFNFEEWQEKQRSNVDSKKEISEDLNTDDNEGGEEVLLESVAGDDVDLNLKELENILKTDDVPYIAEKYLDDPLNGNMNKLRNSRPKKSIMGGQLKGKAKKEKKIVIGLSSRKNK